MRALVPLLFIALPALAQEPPCGDRAEMVANLAGKYGEAASALGLSSEGLILEIFNSDRTGTWTILSTGPDGETCIVAVGEMWFFVPQGAPT
jgi:hypothetical protein